MPIEEKNLYILGQVGISFMEHNFQKNLQGAPDIKTQPSYYIAAGVGFNVDNLVLELTGSLNRAKITMDGKVQGITIVGESVESNYNLNLNIGYRIRLTKSKKETDIKSAE